MSDIDSNKIAADVVSSLVKDFVNTIKSFSSKLIKSKYDYISVDFSDYLQKTYYRCSYVRTIINKDRSFELSEIYVPGSFVSSDEEVSDEELVQRIRNGENSVIVGFGGIGKTMFTKFLWKSVFRNPQGKVPIFLELRRLNSITSSDIKSFIRVSMSNSKAAFDEALFNTFCNAGHFIFILDGFDELTDSKKKEVGALIIEMAYDHPDCSFVISSRYISLFSSWSNFTRYKARPFNKQQTQELVRLIPFDESVKKKFSLGVIEKKYHQYESFLSTPLLCLMMLMTYSQFTEVPDKRSIFYRFAFLTLYSLHDSSKENFKRDMKSELALDDFEKIFSIFCMITYAEQKFEFDDISLLNNLQRAEKFISKKCDIDLLIGDISESVNLMFKDGDVYLFTHRSFQEYFAAYAILTFFPTRMGSIIPKVQYSGDSVLSLMYEMNSDIVEENYIIARYEEFGEKIDKLLRYTEPKDILSEVGYKIQVSLDRSAKNRNFSTQMYSGWPRSDLWDYIMHIEAFCVDGKERNYKEIEPDGWDVSRRISEQIARSISQEVEGNYIFMRLDIENKRVYYGDTASKLENQTYDISEKKFEKSLRQCEKSLTDASINIKSRIVAAQKKIQFIKSRTRNREDRFEDFLLASDGAHSLE